MWLALLTLVAQSADFQAGVKALEANRNDAAVELFSKAAAADPQDYAPQFQLALAYSLLGKNTEAIAHYRSALELKPGLYEAQINLGICLLRVKDSDDAIPVLKSAAAQKPRDFQPAYYLGRALLDEQQWREAATAFAAALDANAGSASAELGLGQALAHQSRLAEAEPHYRQAAALDPALRDALLQLASLEEDQHQAAAAIAIYREFPDNAAAQERLGRLLLDTGHADQALAPLEAAVSRSPTTANRVTLAQAYVNQKSPGQAAPLLAQAIADEPKDYELRMFYGRVLRDQRKFNDAAPQFLAAAGLRQNSAEPWNELAAALVVAGQYSQALSALDRVRALGAESSGQLYFRAVALDHLHQLKDAVENYNKFLEASQGKSPDQEFIARQRVRILKYELGKR